MPTDKTQHFIKESMVFVICIVATKEEIMNVKSTNKHFLKEKSSVMAWRQVGRQGKGSNSGIDRKMFFNEILNNDFYSQNMLQEIIPKRPFFFLCFK